MSDNVPAVIERPPAPVSVFIDLTSFENGQRIAKMLAMSQLIPKDFQNNLPDCMIALELAQRIGASPLAIMQNTNIIHGRPSYAATFVIAMINSCGRYSPLRFEITEKGKVEVDARFLEWNPSTKKNTTKTKKITIEDKVCVAWAYERETGEKLVGPPVSISLAAEEGWYLKDGSKWQSMPEIMLRYRAASFFGKLYAPELLMGMKTTEEMGDILQPVAIAEPAASVEDTAADLNARFSNAKEQQEVQSDPQEAMPEPDAKAKAKSSEKPEDKKKDKPQKYQPEFMGKATGQLVPRTDPDVPAANLQQEVRRCRSTLELDKWRSANFKRIESMLSDEGLAHFLDWVQAVYEMWKAEEA